MAKAETKKKTKAEPVMSAASIELRNVVLRDIGAKWDRLDEADIAGLKSADDLVQKLVTRYGADAEDAQKKVASFLNGRHF